MGWRWRTIFILLLTLVLSMPDALAEVVVIMRREANSTGKYLRVCDVARVDGPGEQAKEVALVILGPSPHRGETREITRWDIEARLFEMGIDARVNFAGNDMVRVYGDGAMMSARDGSFQELFPIPAGSAVWDRSDGSEVAGVQRVRGNTERPARPYDSRFENMGLGKSTLAADARRRVELALADYFASRYKNSPSRRTDIEIEAKVLSASADIPYSAHDLRVVEAVDGQIPGKATLRVKVKNKENDPFREVDVVADVDVFGETLVAARHLSRGELLSERDVAIARIRMKAGTRGYLPPNRSAAAGREAKRTFKPGDPILADEAEIGDAVKRGAQVVVENRGRGWAVQTKAKALGSGAIGDVVTVQDAANKTKYQARIIAPGTVTAVLKRDAHGFIDKD